MVNAEPNPAGAAYWLSVITDYTADGLLAIKDAKRYGATPDEIIAAVAAGAGADPEAIPTLARMGMRKALENL